MGMIGRKIIPNHYKVIWSLTINIAVDYLVGWFEDPRSTSVNSSEIWYQFIKTGSSSMFVSNCKQILISITYSTRNQIYYVASTACVNIIDDIVLISFIYCSWVWVLNILWIDCGFFVAVYTDSNMTKHSMNSCAKSTLVPTKKKFNHARNANFKVKVDMKHRRIIHWNWE